MSAYSYNPNQIMAGTAPGQGVWNPYAPTVPVYYNPGIPAQPVQPQPVQPQPVPAQQAAPPQQAPADALPPIDAAGWAQGAGAAKAAFVQPGRTAIFLDSEKPFLYMKYVFPNGRPAPLMGFRIEKVDLESEVPTWGGVTREEFEELAKKVSMLSGAREASPVGEGKEGE